MKKSILIATSSILMLACDSPKAKSGEASIEKAGKDTTTHTDTAVQETPAGVIEFKELVSGTESSVIKPSNLLINSQAQYDSLWKAALSKSGFEQPKVDFANSNVIAVFQGQVNTGGHSMVITSIQATGDGYSVSADHRSPGKSCMSTQAVEHPFYLGVVTPAMAGKVSFNISKKEVECE